MSKILEEVRGITAEALAKKQKQAESNYPDLLNEIKKAAALGKTTCNFPEYRINEFVKKLLEADGFRAWATTETTGKWSMGEDPKKIWVVCW